MIVAEHPGGPHRTPYVRESFPQNQGAARRGPFSDQWVTGRGLASDGRIDSANAPPPPANSL